MALTAVQFVAAVVTVPVSVTAPIGRNTLSALTTLTQKPVREVGAELLWACTDIASSLWAFPSRIGMVLMWL